MVVGTYCCISPPLQPNSDRGGWVGGGGVGRAQVEVMDFTCTAARVSSWPVLGVKGYKCRECSSLPLTTGAQVTRAALPESRQRSDFARNFRMCSAIPAWNPCTWQICKRIRGLLGENECVKADEIGNNLIVHLRLDRITSQQDKMYENMEKSNLYYCHQTLQC